jgi:hypothetical protein
MTSVISASSNTDYYSALFSANSSSSSNWLADAFSAIQNENNEGGLLGMLDNAGGDGSIDSFLGQSSTNANAFATISQTSVTNAGTLYAQIASQNQQEASQAKVQQQLDALSASQQSVQPKNVLDPVIYFSNGSTLDTNNNILTMPDGTQYDSTTGAKYVDPASIMQLANGAYLNTQTNILTTADGTEIDTVTGLKVSVTA